MVSLKYLSNFWRTLEIPLINCDITVILTWSANGFIIDNLVDNQVPKFALTDKSFMFQLWFYQLKIMKNFYSN